MNVKKLLSTLLAAAMVVTLAPLNVFAADAPDTATAIIDWSRTSEDSKGRAVFKNMSTKNWDWEAVQGLAASEHATAKVWDGQSNPYYDDYVDDLPGDHATHPSATWERYSSDKEKSDIRRFQGVFTIPSGFDVSDYVTLSSASTSYGSLGNIVPINDNIYIFLYKEGTEITNANYLNYLAFWTGTSNQDGVTSFHNREGTLARQYQKPEKPTEPSRRDPQWKWDEYYRKLAIYNEQMEIYNDLRHTDGWYAQAASDNVGEIMLAQDPYADEDTRYVIDMFVEDYAVGGGMDKVNLVFNKAASKNTVVIKYYQDDVEDDNAHLLGSVSLKGKQIGESIQLAAGTGKGQLNYLKPSTGGYLDGAQTGTTPYQVVAGVNEIKVLYTKQKYNVTVQYYDADDKGNPSAQSISEALIGKAPAGPLTGDSYITNVSNELVPVKKVIPEYEYDSSDPLTVSSSGSNILKLYYDCNEYPVTFEVVDDLSVQIPSQNVKYNQTATEPADPTKAGYEFDGWYTNKSAAGVLSDPFVFTTPITAVMTLYGQWLPKTVPAGNATIIKLEDDGTTPLSGAAFTVNSSSVSLKAGFENVFEMPMLEYGTEYTIHEETTPVGHNAGSDFTVRLNAAANGFEFATAPAPSNVTLDGLAIKVTNSKRTDLSYSFEYYQDNFTSSTGTATVSNKTYGQYASGSDDQRSVPVGYKRDYYTAKDDNSKITGQWPLIAADGSTVIYVKYVKDAGQTKNLSYKVEYYKDGSRVTSDDVTVTKNVWVNDTTVPVAAGDFSKDNNKYTGYKFGHTDPATIPADIAGGGVIKVYYVKDAEDTKSLSYTVEYYKDGNHVDGDDVPVTKAVWVNDSTLPVASGDFSTDGDKYTGYKFDHTDPTTIPANIAGGSTIKVYYVKDAEDTKNLSYTVEYYKDGNHVDGDDVPVTKAVWVNDTTVPVAAGDFSKDNNKYTGYKFGHTDPATIPADIAGGGIIKVYYVIDFTQWVNVDFVIVGNVNNPKPATQTILKGEKATEPTGDDLPTKTGYHLNGWYTDRSCTRAFNFNTSVNTKMTLYAKWVGNDATYSIKYYQQSKTNLASYVEVTGDAQTDLSAKVGELVTVLGHVNKYPGYVVNAFKSTITATVSASSETVLSVYYNLIPYPVIFMADRNGTLEGQKYFIKYYQDTFPDAPNPIPNSNYEFKGWRRNRSSTLVNPITELFVTEAVTYTAIFEEIPKFTVNFAFVDAPAGAPSVPTPITNVLRGSTVSRPTDPDFAGYEFDGWYTDENCRAEFDFANDTITENKTLYGKFDAESVNYEVRHLKEDRDNLGQYLDPIDVVTGSEAVGETITADANNYAGYELVGEENTKTHQVVAGDVDSTIVLEFQYDLIPYKVTFKPGEHGTLAEADGDGNVVNNPVYYGDALTAPEVTVADSDEAVYTFIGWDSDGDDDVDYTSDNLPSVTDSATYTAVYTSKGVYTYTVEHWIEGEEEPFLTHSGTAIEGETVSVSPEQVAEALERLGNEYQTVGNPYETSIVIPTEDNVMIVYYEKKPNSNITIVHQYYRNNATLENEVSKNAGIVDPGTEVDAAKYQEPGSYTYWKTEFERDPLSEDPEAQEIPLMSRKQALGAEEQETAAELEAKIKEDRAQILKDHPDATEDEIDQWLAEYSATMVDGRYQTLKDKLDDLNARISELEPEDKDDGSSEDRNDKSSDEATGDETTEDQSEEKAVDDETTEDQSEEKAVDDKTTDDQAAGDETTEDQSEEKAVDDETTDDQTADDETTDDQTADDETTDDQAADDETTDDQTAGDETADSDKEDGENEDQAKLLAELKKERAEGQDQFDDLVETRDQYEFLKPLYAHTKSLSELTGVPMTLAAMDDQVAEEAIWPPVEGKFTYEEGYAYTITISYNRVEQNNGGDDDNDNDDDDDDDDSGNTVSIINPRVPLSQLPKEELVTILDQDVPLGNLPKTGGSAENAAGSLGAMAMILGVLMKVFGKSHKDNQ